MKHKKNVTYFNKIQHLKFKAVVTNVMNLFDLTFEKLFHCSLLPFEH